MPGFPVEVAAYAQYLTASSRQLAHTPKRLSNVEATAPPMAALTAWQALVETADVQAGERVLITGAAGGIGHLAVQIATAAPPGTLSLPSSAPTGRSTTSGRGSTMPCATSTSSWTWPVARSCCAVPTLRDGGLLTAVTLRWDLASEAADDRVRVTHMLIEPDRAGLEAIAEPADNGRLRVHVAQTFPRRRRPGRMSSARPDRAKASSSSRSTDARRATSSTHLTAASRGTWCEASL